MDDYTLFSRRRLVPYGQSYAPESGGRFEQGATRIRNMQRAQEQGATLIRQMQRAQMQQEQEQAERRAELEEIALRDGHSYAPESEGAMRIRQMQRAQEQAVRRAAEIAAEARPLTVQYNPRLPDPDANADMPGAYDAPAATTLRGYMPPATKPFRPAPQFGDFGAMSPEDLYATTPDADDPVTRAVAAARNLPAEAYRTVRRAVTSPAATAKAVANAVLSGEATQSNGEPVVQNGVINWGDPDNPADFFRADQALQELNPYVEPETPPEPADEGYSNGGIVSGLLNEVADFVNPGFAGGGEVEGEYDYVEPGMVYDDEYDYVEPELVYDDEYDYVEPEMIEDLDGFAEGGPVLLQDEYPTEYMPEVGRQVMAGGGPAEDMFDVDMTPEQARQRAVANIQPQADYFAAARAEEPVVDEAYVAPSVTPRAPDPYIGPALPGQFKDIYKEPSVSEKAMRVARDVASNYAGNVAHAFKGGQGMINQAYGDLSGKSGPLGRAMAPFNYTLGVLGMGLSPLTGAAESAGQGVGYATGNKRAGDVAGFAAGFLDPSHAALLGKGSMAAAAIPMATKIAKEVATAPRQLTPLGFYSQGAEAAAGLPQAKGTPEQFAAMLQRQGVKPAEMEGFREAFAGKPSVTREDVAQHFRERIPQIEETVLGGRLEDSPEYQSARTLWIEENAARAAENSGDIDRARDFASASDDIRDWHLLEAEKAFNEKALDQNFVESLVSNITTPTKHGDYVVPGGENYREVLLKLPSSPKPEVTEKYGRFGFTAPDGKYREYWSKEEAEQAARSYYRESGDFTSNHWNEPNVLAHLRLSDRTGPNGEKILHLEELQSDWAQKGRKSGFSRPNPSVKLSYRQNHKNKFEVFSNKEKADEFIRTLPEGVRNTAEIVPVGGFLPGVSPAPYVTSTAAWTDLGLKRALKEAADGGYERLVWTPGAEQARRYDLSQHLDELKYMRQADGTFNIYAYKHGEVIATKLNMTPDQAAEFVGKEVVEKMSKTPPPPGEGYIFYNLTNGNRSERYPTKEAAEAAMRKFREDYPNVKGSLAVGKVFAEQGQMQSLSGKGLEIGGEGMKGYYDKIVPTQLQKMLKKLDPSIKIGRETVGGIEMPVIPITPKLREAIRGGLPAYAAGGYVGMAGGGVPEYDALAADATYDEAAKKNLDQDIIDYEASMARIAQQPEAIRQMTHAPEKPKRPVTLSTGFGDYNLGSASYDVAAAKQALLNTLYGVKTVPAYFTPAAPVALASDTVEAALNAIKNYKKGDYIGAAAEVGLGVAPGAAVYRKPLANALRAAGNVLTSPAGRGAAAGATGAAVMSPDDAEAANILKALKAIRAYHGSPYKFDKFDISKIGTGEGAQAYGHGLYFAENEGVAKDYRKNLSSGTYVTQAGDIFDPYKSLEHLNVRVAAYKGIDNAIERAKGLLETTPEIASVIKRDLDKLYALKAKNTVPNEGHMYEVNIYADPAKFLEWEVPFSNQSETVQNVLREMGVGNKWNESGVRGSEAYKRISGKLAPSDRISTHNDPLASDSLLKSGVPGIKYLDAGSRPAGEGSSNYVVFDPSIVEILRRYAHGGPVEERKGYAGGQAVTKAVKAAKQLFKGSDLIKKDPAAATAKLSDWTPSGDADFGQALKNYEYSSTKKGDLQPWKEFDPEQAYKEGALLAGILGDRSAAGRIVDAINGVKLSTPVDLRGGGEFQRSLEGPEVWASRPSAVKTMQTRIRKNLENLKADPDNPLYAAMVLMGNPAIDSTQMMAKAMLRQIEATRNKIDPKAAEELDALIRKSHPDWPGVLSPVDAERWLAKNEVGKRTSSILQAFDKSGRQAGGLPNLGAARFAMMDPRLVSADQGSTGFAVSRLDPKGATNVAAHDTYPTGMLGPTKSSADYLGGTKYQVPLQVMFPDWFKTVTPTYLDTRSGLMKKTSPVMIQQSVMTQVPMQRANQEWLDNIMKHYEKNPKPWGYAHGGPVEERDGYSGGSAVVSKALRAIRELMEGAKDLPRKERMMVVHKTRPSSLELYEKLGGMPAPSTAVIKPSEPLMDFGSITLVGDPEKLAIPGARNPIFASDAYTPRMPEIFFKNDKPYFEIYNKYGEPSTRKATIQSVLRQMKSSGIRGGENFGGSEGSIRSQITPEFRNVNELAAARSRLNSDAYKEAKYRSNYMDIYRRMRGASLWKESDPGKDLETVASIARRYGGLDPRSIMGELGRNYTIDKDFASDVANYLKGLRDMPAPYFEGKPQRVVPLSDFSGALIPEGRNARNAADILNRQGVKNIEFYSPKQDIGDGAVERQLYDTLIERFPNQQFAHGGPVEEYTSEIGSPLPEPSKD